MIDDLQELRTFVRIVSAGSLSAAARATGVRLDAVSKRLASLEKRVGTRLVARTTRRLAPTDEGRELYERATRILAELDEAETVLRDGQAEPLGVLRISAPVTLGRRHVAIVCADLMRAHPKVSVELMLTDRLVDLVDERIDVVVRIGEPADSSAVMRKLVDNDRILVAAPSYVATHGHPAEPAALKHHACLTFGLGPTTWALNGPQTARREVKVGSRLRSNSGDVAYDWALAGYGIMLKSRIDAIEELAAGTLVHVLPDWRSDPAPICALYPSNRMPGAKVTRFLDLMAARLRRSTRRLRTRGVVLREIFRSRARRRARADL